MPLPHLEHILRGAGWLWIAADISNASRPESVSYDINFASPLYTIAAIIGGVHLYQAGHLVYRHVSGRACDAEQSHQRTPSRRRAENIRQKGHAQGTARVTYEIIERMGDCP